jgi:RNA polymerase sigma-70 factor (ECF subfamily)
MNPSQSSGVGTSGGTDRDEFSLLYRTHARQIYCFIRTMVTHQADAEDVFQDVSAILWQKFSQFQSGTNFLAWANQIAKFCVLNHRDYQKRANFLLGNQFIEVVAGDASNMFESLEAQHQALAECYARLSARDRSLVDRRYRKGVSVKDLAEQMGRPLRTVYRLLERVHIALLDCVERRIGKERVV